MTDAPAMRLSERMRLVADTLDADPPLWAQTFRAYASEVALLEQQVPRWVSVKEHEPEFKARLWVTDGKTVWDDWFGYEWIREGDAFKTVEGTVIAWQPYFTPLPPEVKL